MSESKSDARYTMGRTQGEEDRLIQQSQLYDAVTRRFLWEAGISSGMKVLDIGSGPGDVALTAAELVGPEGAVVGVDVNPEILETARARAPGSRVYQRRIRCGGRPDLGLGKRLRRRDWPAGSHVHGRSRRRPETTSDPPASGGIVAFQEADFTPYRQMYHPDTPETNKLIDWLSECLSVPGRISIWASACTAHSSRPAYPSHTCIASIRSAARSLGSGTNRCQQLSQHAPAYRRVRDRHGGRGRCRNLAERARQEVVAAKRPLALPPHVTAWAQLAS